ncbi:NAD(P)H-hydrate dehydratase [Candidatus Acetothermia bacterium]|nr:NAD(P)H-hydrate dehydratase [Candidatus Acetothermia bacterium]
MQPILTSQAQRELDERAATAGIGSLALMESAGRSAAEIILSRVPDIENKRVVIICGRGGNGGDGLVVSRYLQDRSPHISVFLLAQRGQLRSDTATNAAVLEKRGAVSLIYLTDDLSPLQKAIAEADVVIDALLGIGLDRPLAGEYSRVIEMINDCKAQCIALDIPSGLSADNGRIFGCAVEAELTIAMEYLKPVHLLFPARHYIGEVAIAAVEYPERARAEINPSAFLVERSDIKSLFPARRIDGHKGDFGRVLVIAGSQGMTGAAILTAQAALRSGAGLVYLAAPQSLNSILETTLIETITIPLPDYQGRLSNLAKEPLLANLREKDVVAIGPGLSRSLQVGNLVRMVLAETRVPVVLDADGIHAFADHLHLLKEVETELILTPHPGELAGLIKVPAAEINADRFVVARSFAQQYNLYLILKGKPTVIASPSGEIFVNPTGNTGLASGGSGDVLTGIIAGLIGQGASSLDAALLGVYLHGFTADLLAVDRAERAILPTDLISFLPQAIFELGGRQKIDEAYRYPYSSRYDRLST